jgi:enoyl-CoA hydratase/carnithine racemase
MVSGRLIDAQEALTAGLVTRLYPPDELLDAAYELASVLVDKTAPVSIAVIRQMLYRLSALESPLDVQRVDSRLIAGIVDNPDAIEGVTSFMQRRAPRWTLTVDNDIPDWLPWRQP